MMNHLGIWLCAVTVGLLACGLVLDRARPHGGTVAIHANVESSSSRNVTLWVRIGVTSFLLLAALFVILSNRYPADEQKWAFGVVGTILGYWLKG
jgi:hypothetical protein